jgi:hypothetical protein
MPRMMASPVPATNPKPELIAYVKQSQQFSATKDRKNAAEHAKKKKESNSIQQLGLGLPASRFPPISAALDRRKGKIQNKSYSNVIKQQEKREKSRT